MLFFICFLLLGNGKISLMIITPSAANRIITNSLSHLFVKCCITNVLCVYKLPLCYTLLMLYCISVRLFDSIIPCRLTISLFLYIPMYHSYICISVAVYLFCSLAYKLHLSSFQFSILISHTS